MFKLPSESDVCPAPNQTEHVPEEWADSDPDQSNDRHRAQISHGPHNSAQKRERIEPRKVSYENHGHASDPHSDTENKLKVETIARVVVFNRREGHSVKDTAQKQQNVVGNQRACVQRRRRARCCRRRRKQSRVIKSWHYASLFKIRKFFNDNNNKQVKFVRQNIWLDLM